MVVSWLARENLTNLMIGGKDFTSRSSITQVGILVVFVALFTVLIFVSIKCLGLVFPRYFRFLTEKIDTFFITRNTLEPRMSFLRFLVNLTFTTYLTVFCYAFSEWLFFVTKPSFMDRMSAWGKVEVLFLVSWTLLIVNSPLVVLFTFWGFLPRFKVFPKTNFQIALCIPSFFLAITGLLLIDNFTYIVFRFEIINSTTIWRALYAVLFCWIWIKTYQFVRIFFKATD